jgi:DNA-directed RNA polymerase subunit RPC12/RpoP
MAVWHLNCRNCNQRLARFNIEDDFENLFLPARPNFLKGGKQYECPNCGHKATTSKLTYSICPSRGMNFEFAKSLESVDRQVGLVQ